MSEMYHRPPRLPQPQATPLIQQWARDKGHNHREDAAQDGGDENLIWWSDVIGKVREAIHTQSSLKHQLSW